MQVTKEKWVILIPKDIHFFCQNYKGTNKAKRQVTFWEKVSAIRSRDNNRLRIKNKEKK